MEKPKPTLMEPTDAIVRVTMGSICSSDLHIKHGSVPRAVPGITVGHEMAGVVEEVGADVTRVKPGDRVTVNVETFCGECFFCKRGFVNNCTDKNGGWALGCRIDGGQAPFVRVPFADNGLTPIPEGISDEKALFTGDILATHNGLCCDPILTHGTPEQKAKYLPMLTTGHKVGAFALTEPNAGSDASKGQTEAVLDGDHYVLNGAKVFITNGYVADVFVVFAMTDKTKGTKGISAFIVESSFPGFSVGKHEVKMGLHGSPTSEIVFTDCIVPKENLLGKEGKGFSIAMQTLDGGRIGIAAQGLGIAEGALAEAVNYAKGRVQFGKPISKFQNTQFVLADMELGCEAGRLLTYQAAWLKGQGVRYTKEAAMAKLFTSEHANKTATKALQIFGGYGYTKDYPMERMMRDAKITEIYEGTSEVQRIVISANMGL